MIIIARPRRLLNNYPGEMLVKAELKEKEEGEGEG
jgi:hypothetical protein